MVHILKQSQNKAEKKKDYRKVVHILKQKHNTAEKKKDSSTVVWYTYSRRAATQTSSMATPTKAGRRPRSK